MKAPRFVRILVILQIVLVPPSAVVACGPPIGPIVVGDFYFEWLMGSATGGSPSDPANPYAAVARALSSYQWKNLAGYSATLAPEFRFETINAIDQVEVSLSRDEEIRTAEHIFNGFTGTDGVAYPAMASLDVTVGRWSLDPRSTSTVAYVVLNDVELMFEWEDGRTEELGPMQHEIVLFRRDGESGIPEWQIRRWREWARLESLMDMAFKDRLGAPEDPSLEKAGGPTMSIEFGIRPLASPLRSPGVVRFGLPRGGDARLRLVDVAGRAVFKRDLSDLPPGEHEVRLADAGLAPGVYWLALEQGSARATRKVVWLR